MALDDNWPKHEDGSPKNIGEMTSEEQLAVFTRAGKRLEAEFNTPAVQESFRRLFSREDDDK